MEFNVTIEKQYQEKYDFQNVDNMRNLIFFVTIFVCFNSIAKPEIDTIIIADNSKKIIFKCDTEKIYFFCPINSLSKEVYLEKFEKFFKKRNIQSLDKLNFPFG